MVRIGDTNTDVSVQCQITGGSTTSEVNSEAARIGCEIIKERVAHLRFELWKEKNAEPTWQEIVALAYQRGILMSQVSQFLPPGHENNAFKTPYTTHMNSYFGFGAGC